MATVEPPGPGTPRVAVVMAAYRAAQTLPAAACSVLGQAYPALELWIALRPGDGETRAAAQALADPRVHLVEQEGSGIANARNAALRALAADLVMFLDADDAMFPGTIARYVADWQRGPRPALRFAHWEAVDPGGRTAPRRVPDPPVRGLVAWLALQNAVATCTAMVDTAILDEVGGFDERYDHAEDWDLWLRIAARYPLRRVPTVAAQYRQTKLQRIYPRDFFTSERAIVERTALPAGQRRRALLLQRGRYGAYYLRTLAVRRGAQRRDVRPADLCALPPAIALRWAWRHRPGWVTGD